MIHGCIVTQSPRSARGIFDSSLLAIDLQFGGLRRLCLNHAMDITNLNEVSAFITKDGSEIRELLAHRNSGIRNQSLAEARLVAGASTQEHYHPQSEEIYFITQGSGRIRIEGESREVQSGDAIAIPPGQRHKLWNTGGTTLHLLCCCSPAYEHTDTVITESGP